MKKVHFEMRNRLCLFLLGFQNLNMYSKGTYIIKVESTIGEQKCSISKCNEKQESLGLVQKDPLQQYSKNFMIKYQNEKVDLNQLFIVQTPLFKFNQEINIVVRFTLFLVESSLKCSTNSAYTRLASSLMIIRFPLNSILEYCQCIFQEPFLSSLSLLVFNQPTKVVIQTRNYKHSSSEEIKTLKKQVKRLRYNNYLMQNKFKKFMYNDFKYQFTLPKMFVNGDNQMVEVQSSEQNFLNYLILYENIAFTPEIMNYELTSISQRNQSLFEIFKNSCSNGTIFISKLRMENEEKENRKFRQYITKQDHKSKFCSQYKAIIREKLKLLEKEKQAINNEEALNNIIMKGQRESQKDIPFVLPTYPTIIHQVQKLKQSQVVSNDEKESHNKARYIFLLAHGYQGCSQDLIFIANGLKRKFKKSKYLILKSFQNMMDQSLVEMSKKALEQVNAYLNTFNFKEKQYRIVMLGHSMGGLILRSVASCMPHSEFLYSYISMGTPHLGYLQGIKFIIKAGISFLSNISSNVCMSQLSSKDNNNLHECLIYKLSNSASLSTFKKVVLLSSVHDKYVSWHSARIQDYHKDTLKQYNFIEHEMIHNILGKQSKIERIDRIQVDFKLLQNNMDNFIGRSSHIKFLNNHQFIELFVNGVLPSILES